MPKSFLKFLADENLNLKVVRPLTKNGYNIKVAPKGIKNGELIKLAMEESCIFITHDKDFLDSKKYPANKTPGIVIIAIHPQVETTILKALDALFNSIAPNDIHGKLVVLELDGYIIDSNKIPF